MLLQRLFFLYIFNTDIKHDDISLLFVAVIYNLQKVWEIGETDNERKGVFSYYVSSSDGTHLLGVYLIRKRMYYISRTQLISTKFGRKKV